MKLVRKSLDQFGCGDITLKPSSSEDMWFAYNLIAVGDRVTCGTFRKMQKVSTTGTTSTTRIKMTLTVVVTKVDFEPKAGKLRVSGQVTDNAQIKQGSFHTLELEAPRKFTIHKELWDSVALQMVAEACAEKSSADLAAVVLEMGLANVCLVTKNMTVTKAKIELSVPRKRAGSTQYEKQRDKFFEYIVQALLQHIDWAVVKAVIIASPGFVKVCSVLFRKRKFHPCRLQDQFMEYLLSQVGKRADLQPLLDNKDRFVKARCSSGHKHSLKEVLQDAAIMEQLTDVKAAAEVAALQRFYETFNSDASRAVYEKTKTKSNWFQNLFFFFFSYGLKHVQAANDAAAIDVLLLTNELFKVEDVQMRKL